MATYLSVHGVQCIQVRADGQTQNGKDVHWWQTLSLFDSKGDLLGEVTLHFADASAALPLGEQPPYFGFDPRRMSALEVGEVAPF